MKKILLFAISAFMILCSFTQAQELLPKWWDNAADYVSWVSVWWEVMQRQKELAKTLEMPDKIRTWIMDWDTILDYCAYLARFLWEVALLVWALAIIFLWYKRITKNLFKEKNDLTPIIIWLLVVIFAYVIVKLLWYAFIS